MRAEPLKPARFARQILMPALTELAPVIDITPSPAAARLLTAIAIQETDLASRYQRISGHNPGPARGWWQFERAGVRGVRMHHASLQRASSLCVYLGVDWSTSPIWRALEGSDLLAAGFARLLLWTDPRPLPTDRDEAWLYYLRLWRPGLPRPEKWSAAWAAASRATGAYDD